MNIDLEKIKAEIERLKAQTGEEYFEANKDAIKQDIIEKFEKAKINDINILTAILNSLPNFEVKTEQQESQKQSIEENSQTEQTIQS